MTFKIIENVEYHLERRRGVVRYKNDRYYNKNKDRYSEEAEWTMGFSLAFYHLFRTGGFAPCRGLFGEIRFSSDTGAKNTGTILF